MATTIPPVSEVRARLAAMSVAQVQVMSEYSKVPVGTLMKIRHGITKNPGIETVRAFFPLLHDLPADQGENKE